MFQLSIYKSSTNPNPLSVLNLGGQFLNLSTQLAWSGVGLLGIVFIIVSFVLVYHWKKFGFEKFVIAKMALSYFSVSAGLLIITAISMAVYLNSL